MNEKTLIYNGIKSRGYAQKNSNSIVYSSIHNNIQRRIFRSWNKNFVISVFTFDLMR